MLRVSEHKQRSFFDAGYLVSDEREFAFARFYAREILPLVTDRDFVGVYSEIGRGAVSPALLLHVSALATIEGLSDRQAAKAVKVRLDWKVALGLRVDYPGFHSTRLVRFRSRLLGRTSKNEQDEATEEEKERARMLLDRIIQKLVDYGLVKRNQSVRLDSTHVLTAAKNINRYQTIFESMKLAVRAVDTEDSSLLGNETLAPLREKYSKPLGAYDLKKERVRKDLEVATKDALRLLKALEGEDHERLKGLKAVRVLRKAVEDNVELRRKGIRRKKGRPKKGADDGSLSGADMASLFEPGGLSEEDVEVVERQSGDRMITPHDESARLGVKKKGKFRWVGSKTHAAETVPEEGAQDSFVGDFNSAPANVPDIEETLPSLERLAERGLEPPRTYVDAGYVSGEPAARSRDDHGIELYGPPPEPHATGRFQPEQFSVDFEAGSATCPAGKICDSFKLRYEEETFSGADARFNKATCSECPLAAKCRGKGKSWREVSFTAYHHDLVKQRQKARTPEFKTEYKKRAPCEGIFADLSGPLGLRRSSVKGPAKVFFEQALGMVAINVKRFFKVLQRRPEVVPMRA
jgi:transposase